MSIFDTIKKAIGGTETMPEKILGRNDPCWCGSGKKYKRCHLEADDKKRSAAMAATLCKGPT